MNCIINVASHPMTKTSVAALQPGPLRERVKKLEARLWEVSSPPEKKACYWISGDDDGTNFCRNCCIREIRFRRATEKKRDLILDGGFEIDHDSDPYCERCGVGLRGFFTDYCVTSMIDGYSSWQSEAISPEDAHELAGLLESANQLSKGDWKGLRKPLSKLCKWLEKILDHGAVTCIDKRKPCKLNLRIARKARGRCALSHFPRVSLCGDHRAHTWAPAYLSSVNASRRQRQAQGIKVKGVCRG